MTWLLTGPGLDLMMEQDMATAAGEAEVDLGGGADIGEEEDSGVAEGEGEEVMADGETCHAVLESVSARRLEHHLMHRQLCKDI